MVYWNRFISYIYRYHEDRKCENVGFAKVAKAGRTGKISVGLKNGMNSREEMYDVYIYRETLPSEQSISAKGDAETIMVPVPVYIGGLRLRNGHGEDSFNFCWDNVAGSGKPITAFAGVIIFPHSAAAYRETHFYECDMFCSSWTDSKVDYSGLRSARPASYPDGDVEQEVSSTAVAETCVEKGSSVIEAVSEEYAECNADPDYLTDGHEGNTLSETGAAIDSMFEEHEKLPLLPGNCLEDGIDSVIESVKITPNDIGLLDMCNWKLGVNSFLTHGYYSYKYLMLGKVLFTPDSDNVSYILGVPGVYSSREKYLADIFGFDRFVPEKETQIKTGSFGYWIVDIR